MKNYEKYDEKHHTVDNAYKHYKQTIKMIARRAREDREAMQDLLKVKSLERLVSIR